MAGKHLQFIPELVQKWGDDIHYNPDYCDINFNFQIGKIYYISRCTLKPANKQYSTLKNQYEMTMNNDTEVVACHDEIDDIPTISFDFHPLSEVETREKNSVMGTLNNIIDRKSEGDDVFI